ncbi:hypothetical protein [Streptomyces sp. NPDC048521]|uniref:hypothetical protein n=1 Tax=Streptomyces sp. NPDC048521 TaxID=3365566 RepID=UPI003714FF72
MAFWRRGVETLTRCQGLGESDAGRGEKPPETAVRPVPPAPSTGVRAAAGRPRAEPSRFGGGAAAVLGGHSS